MTYQELYKRGKAFIKKEACMKFNDEKKSPLFEKDASVLCLGAGILHVRKYINCPTGEAYDNRIC